MKKLKQILTEEELSKSLIKVLNIMLKMGFDPEDLSDNFNKLDKNLHIKDDDLKSEAILYFRKYHNIAEEKGSFKEIGDVNLDYDPDDIEDEIMALSIYLGVHPLLIEPTAYGEYEYIIDGDEYRVLDENSADEEFQARAEEYIEETLEYQDDLGWLESYLEMDTYSVEQFCSDEADYRVDDMEDEEIVEEMDMEEELQQRIDKERKKYDRWHELDEEIVEVEEKISDIMTDIENLNEEMYDLRSEAASSEDRDEIADLENEYEGMKQTMSELEEMLEYWEDHLEEIRYEFDELDDDYDDVDWKVAREFADELRDDLREKIAEQMFDDIEYEGWEYFSNNLGYTAKQVVDNGWFDIDMDSAIESLESDRGNIMNTYDGNEDEEYYNGESYYIYRTN
jgi:uncharacterized protein YukE